MAPSISMKLLGFALVVASAPVTAFQSSHRSFARSAPSTMLQKELNPIDEMCIENVAEFCLHEECDIEEYEALINQLEDQKKFFINHVATVESLLARLKNSNHPEYDPTEVSDLITSIEETLANPPKVSA